MAKENSKEPLRNLVEIAHKLADWKGDVEARESIGSLKRELEAEERLRKIKSFLKLTLDPGTYATIQILKVFRDERQHGWKEIRKVADVSKVTLNKKLKELTKEGVLTRYVIASFPPRTRYELNQKGLRATIYNSLVALGKMVYHADEACKNILATCILMNELEFFDVNQIELMVNLFLQDIIHELDGDLCHFLSTLESWGGVMATHTTYIMMLSYWTLIEGFTLNPKMKSLAKNLLKVTSATLKKEFSSQLENLEQMYFTKVAKAVKANNSTPR